MRIPKCVDCRWHPDDRRLCQHPDAELSPITGGKIPRRTLADMRYNWRDSDKQILFGPCGMEGRLFELKVDPLR